MKRLMLLVLVTGSLCSLHAQSLSIETIMQGDAFVGTSPSRVFWGPDSHTIYFYWNPDQLPGDALYKVDLIGDRTPQKVSAEEQRGLWQRSLPNADHSKDLYLASGDIYLYDHQTHASHPVMQTSQRESNATWAADGKGIVFEADNNLFRWNWSDETLIQLTNLKSGNERKDRSKEDEQAEWLKRDQLEYFEVLRDRKERREFQDSIRKDLREDGPKPYYYGDSRIGDLVASPDNRFVTFTLTDMPKDPKWTKVPDYVTEDGYVEEDNARPKVGSPEPTYRFMILDRQRDTVYALSTKALPGIYRKPEYLKDYSTGDAPYVDTFPAPREVAYSEALYNESGTHAVVVVRTSDHKDRWIVALNTVTGFYEVIDHQHDEAWIGGPGVSGWGGPGTLGFLKDVETLYFQSEATGYSHLYTYHFPTKKTTALTQGSYEILSVDLSLDKGYFYLLSNKEGPEQQHYYKLPVNGGDMVKLTGAIGGYQPFLSPDETKLAYLYSYANKPWELYVKDNNPEAAAMQLTHSTTKAFEAYPWRDPEIVTFTARDGAAVKARIYTPARKKRNGAAVIFVHGAGYLQNVHKWWSSYYREYMFHNMLADEGFTVLDIDYRGSAGYGRDWRTAIYRFMGGKDLTDQVDGAHFLAQKYGVDPQRIGIYGGSYGGFITLMAMFTTPGVFKAGAGLRSVTDWAHYNHPYTSNILNLPYTDSIAYYRSSPIYHAEGLQGHLLMLHGMVDSNVHFQDIVRLSQRLIELNKDNWELAVFPKENHGFIEASSWTNEYKRIHKLFLTDLLKK